MARAQRKRMTAVNRKQLAVLTDLGLKTVAGVFALVTVVIGMREYHDGAVSELTKGETEAKVAFLERLRESVAGVTEHDVATRLIDSQQQRARLTWLLSIKKHMGHYSRPANRFFHSNRNWCESPEKEAEYKAGDYLKKDLTVRSIALLDNLSQQIVSHPEKWKDGELEALVNLAIASSVNLSHGTALTSLIKEYDSENSILGKNLARDVTILRSLRELKPSKCDGQVE